MLPAQVGPHHSRRGPRTIPPRFSLVTRIVRYRFLPVYRKYRLISEPIHSPTGTDTPFPIIRYASLAPPAKENASGTPCNRDKVRLESSKNRSLPSGSTEAIASVRIRRGQQFFRQTVLNAYGVKCCISGINVPRLLVASHIKPWSEFPETRLDARNGLCLSSLHDAAFDAGLITVNEDLRLVLSNKLRRYFPQPSLEQNFLPFEGITIRLPEKVAEPDAQFLEYHRTRIFKAGS